MNIDITFGAEINKVSVGVTEKDGIIQRKCKLVLAREFDTLLASGLRGDAKVALRSLESHGLAEVTIPIDGIFAHGIFSNAIGPANEVTIPDLRGLVARAKAGKDQEPPSIKLEFEFEWLEKVWVFLGRNCSAQAQVTIRSIQTEMEFPAGNGKSRGKRPRGAEL